MASCRTGGPGSESAAGMIKCTCYTFVEGKVQKQRKEGRLSEEPHFGHGDEQVEFSLGSKRAQN